MSHSLDPSTRPGASASGVAGTSGSPWPAFFVASIAVFMVSMDSTILYAAFGALRASFPQHSAADLSWILNAYTVVYAAMLIPAGGLADSKGRKRCFQWGCAIFLGASALCGAAPTVPLLVAARALQAVGAALLSPASLSIVLAAFPASKRTVAVSLWGAVGGLAAAVGPALGSVIVEHAGWPWAFYLNVVPGLWALWRSRTAIQESVPSGAQHRLDPIGMVLVIGSIAAMALGIVKLDDPHWSALNCLSTVGLGLVLMMAFVAGARDRPLALVDLTLFKIPSFRWANLATFSFSIAFAMMFFGFFVHLTEVWHYSLSRAGVAVIPGPACVVGVAMLAGRRAAKVGHRPLLVAGALASAATGLWFMLVPGETPAYLTTWLPGMVLSGIGVGLLLPILPGAAVSRLPAAQYALGSAVNQAIRQLGSVIGVALFVTMIARHPGSHEGFRLVYETQIGLSLLTGAIALLIRPAPEGTN